MTQSTRKTDTQIHNDVLDELKWDSCVDEKEVGVQVAGGIVTLTGTVDSWAKRVAAQDAAHRVAGVLDVANDITVKRPGGPVLSDTEVAQAVRRALEWDVLVPHAQITSTVSDGDVTLEGTVDNWRQRMDTELAISRLAGVRFVTNRIVVRPARVTGDVKKAIEQALGRRAEREARRIRVEIADGTVTLTGTVQSRAEHQSVLAAARFTPGVVDVKDYLKTDPA
jgi:osmotically-inducible protein OsmY